MLFHYLEALLQILGAVTPVRAHSQPDLYSQSQKILDPATPQYESRMSAFDSATGDVAISTDPTESFLLPKIDRLNSTTGEQWEFDCTANSGDAGLLVGIYRDAAYAFLGPGNLRLSIDAVWPNGTTWSWVDYLEASVIWESDGAVYGNWSKAHHTYVFKITSDSSAATLQFDTPAIKGTIHMTSLARPRYADGQHFPSAESSTQNAPLLHWVEPIPAADTNVDLTVAGTPLRFDGLGGHMRFWGPRSWFDGLMHWKAFRARVGPFALSFWAATSRVNKGEVYPTVYLSNDGERVFASQRLVRSNDKGALPEEDYFTYEPIVDEAGVRGGLADPAVGYTVELVAPKAGKRWRFTLTHRVVEFEFALSGGAGGTAFVGEAVGGRVGGKRYTGTFFNEQVDISGLKIPSLFITVAGYFHQAKSALLGF